MNPERSRVNALITTGDTLDNGYRFESIPDGISFLQVSRDDDDRDGGGGATIFVNHETSTVPFHFPLDGVTATEGNAQNDSTTRRSAGCA